MTGAAVRVAGLTHVYPLPDLPIPADTPDDRVLIPVDGRDELPLLTVLEDVSFSLYDGDYASITGRSGAGKTTLLSILGGLEPPMTGKVQVGAFDLHELSRDELAAYRRDTVGFVFQHFGLLDVLTAAENVELACSAAGMRPHRRRQRALELLDAVGLAHRSQHLPGALSSGERQRVGIARALVNDPQLLLADEPTGNLDDVSAVVVVELLERVCREQGCTLIVVTHDQVLAQRADTHLELVDGRLVTYRSLTTAGQPGRLPFDVGAGAAAPGGQGWADRVRDQLRRDGRLL